MSHSNSDPWSTDAILGGQAPAPLQGAILGGIDGIQQKLTNEAVTVRLEALDQAWGYGAAGTECLQQALCDRSKLVRRRARWLLRQPQGAQLAPTPLWELRERLDGYPGYSGDYATVFANRPVQEFASVEPLQNPQQVAYALRTEYDANDIDQHIEALLNADGSAQIEAIVFGFATHNSTIDVELLTSLRTRLPNLKALFVGDIPYNECEISWIENGDMSPLLQAFPKLEVLQVRGGEGLEFNPTLGISRHENLKALILETGGLSPQTVHQLYEWEFPALEHLELWFGSENYGGTCRVADLQPLLEELKFPDLLYLGLRNSQFVDEIAEVLVRSQILEGLQVLDLSMSTLGDEGATHLLECPAIRDLETLNVSECYLSGAMVDRLRSLEIEVIAADQREEENDDDPAYRRYCVVSE